MAIVRRNVWLVLLIVGIFAFSMGIAFLVQGITNSNWMSDAMRQEAVTLGLDESAIAEGDVVDSAPEAQNAGDIVREHRRGIAPTYNDLLAGGGFNATNPEHLSYAQALNMENYLYLAVMGFGVTQMLIASGAFMLVMGVGLGVTGLALRGRVS